jgi:hypothetical protein
MTTCTPLKPFRCWQYRKDSTEPAPEWARYELFNEVRDGWWLIESYGRRGIWYTPAEFAERFKLLE